MKLAKVKRPAFNESLTDHPSVKLTATVTHGSVSKEYELNLKVKMMGITDSQAVILDLNDISLPKSTKEDLVLPTIGKNGSAIKWESQDPSVIAIDGRITRPDAGEDNTSVRLTATCTKGEETQTKEFTVEVLSWTINEELEHAVSLVTFDLVKGSNTNSQAIESDLELPKTVGRGVQAEWAIVSSSADSGTLTGKLDISTGKVTRPTHTQGQVTVQIKCTLTKDSETRVVVLPVFILAPLPMTDAEVLSAAKTLLESSSFLGDNESLSKITENMKLPFRVNDPNASRASINWSLASHTSHTPVPSSPYISLSNTAEYCLATITRPTDSQGNVTIALKAELTVNSSSGGSALTDSKYFDMTILKEETP